MRVCAYLNFKGDALAAIKFYGNIFGTKPQYMTYAEMPPSPDFTVTDKIRPMIMHGELFIDREQSIMIADDMRPDVDASGNVSLALLVEKEGELRRIFMALAEGGKVIMPLDKTFWSDVFGCVTDKYGVTWSLNLSNEAN